MVRTAVEIGAFAVLALVVLTLLGVVLYKGGKRTAPPRVALVVTQSQDFASLDPALAQTQEAWELEYATCAKLLNYPAVAGYRGTRLVPEVASSLPRPSRDRLTYTFEIRPGWRFSDGEPVTAHSFTRAFERARSAELVSPAEPYLREVAWWRVHGRTLTIRLRTPAPDFVQRLALPYFCAVPRSAPDRQSDTLPSAGPFAIERYRPGRSLVLQRNPYYHGPRHPKVQRIIYRFGAFSSQIRLQLEQGEADYGVVTPSAFAALAQRFKGDRRHLLVVQQPIVAYLALNTARPLFKDNPWLRRAVNYALDRPALVRLFGPQGAVPSDEYLPPGFPGYEPRHVYPVGEPDLAKASALARGHLRGGHVVFLACGSQACAERAIVVADALRKIGLHVRIDTSPGQFTLAGVRGTAFDIADVITRPDYGDPYGLVDKLLDGRVIRAVGNSNISYYASPRVNRAIDAAQRLSGVARDRAYGRLGIAVARTDAPLAAYAVLNARVFLSTRVGCITYQPIYGVDLAGACVSALSGAASRR
ncbi:MAG: peptide/nickel transport system substrate-binding protein [Gaiellaceae bacterium]|nr:peptide/nickel transport system substrate-binding protein [Gaiellaceae bacterium]